jgi:hypothetical protein
VPYFIEISTYHRFVSSTQTPADIEEQIRSLEIWGKAAHNVYQSDIPKVKAFVGSLPQGKKGIEFTTDVSPDLNTPPYLATWSGNRPGVTTEDDYAKLKVLTIDAYLS